MEPAIKKVEFQSIIKRPQRGLHSAKHLLAKEISEYCREPEQFAMYLGIIKNIGLARAHQIFAEMKQSRRVKTPGKLFLYLSAYEHDKPKISYTKKELAKLFRKKFKKRKKPRIGGEK